MTVCQYCGANLLHTFCDFCGRQAPRTEAQVMLPETAQFIRANASRPLIHSMEETTVLRSLRGMGALRIARQTPGKVSFEWTSYGRALAQELAA